MSAKIVIGNWKMNLSLAQSEALARELASLSKKITATEIWVAPSFISLQATVNACKGTKVKVGAQNSHWDSDGSFTGEVSPLHIKELGCSFVIIGHSERRRHFSESNQLCLMRAQGVLEHGLQLVFCVGESAEERSKKQTQSTLAEQLDGLWDRVPESQRGQVTVAYEPVWAIGTGHAATPQQIEEVHSLINEQFVSSWGRPAPIVYGGSVSEENVETLMKTKLVAGVLVGHASTSIETFSEILTRVKS